MTLIQHTCLFFLLTLMNTSSIEAPLNLRKNEVFNESEKPLEITVKIQLNKIYGINTVDETYIVDGYLVASWKTPKNTIKQNDVIENSIYENQIADEKIGKEIWVPAFEFINVVGNRNIANKQIILHKNGQTTYNERFNAVFATSMDFKMFPFDTQVFTIQLEAFSYDNKKLVFLQTKNPKDFFIEGMSEEWKVIDKKAYVNTQDYSHLSEDGNAVGFSRYNQEVVAKRKIQYYLLQFILPLFLIITISWSVFWISNLSDQLATNFTLMLTVVAFNFNTSNILPSLPYSTFMESLITLGYLSIFISLIIIILGNHLKSQNFNYKRLMNRCKYIFPISFLLLTLLQAFIFF